MARSIYKYPFPITDGFILELPKGAKILMVEMQGQTPCLWALVDTNAGADKLLFRLFGTGHVLPDNDDLEHVASFQDEDGMFVWHLFLDSRNP